MQSNLHLGPTLHNGLFFVRGGGSPCLESCLDLSTTATRPLSFVTKEAVVKRFNCKIKKE